MKQYKTVQVKIHSVGPLVIKDNDNAHNLRNVCFHRYLHGEIPECFNAYLVGEDAQHAILMLGRVIELTYFAMQNGGKFIVNYQYL